MYCQRCGKWAGAYARCAGQPLDDICNCRFEPTPIEGLPDPAEIDRLRAENAEQAKRLEWYRANRYGTTHEPGRMCSCVTCIGMVNGFKDRIAELEALLQDVPSLEYETEYDGQMLALCNGCQKNWDEDHKPDCLNRRIEAALSGRG